MIKTLIIAEAGVNHNGDMLLAKELIDVAAAAGADYVKFQTFKTENLVSPEAEMAAYQEKNTGKKESQFQMLKKLELSYDDFSELKDYCHTKGIKFLSTAFDLESIDFLNDLKIDLFKIPSGEITNYPYLVKIGQLKGKVILSTGMCVLPEIEEAIKVLADAGTPKSNISILHCTTDYPTAVCDVNLKAMLTIKTHFGVDVGYSDHTLGIDIPVAAVAMGAKIIEKHFTLDKSLPGPDHKASLDPLELKQMISAIRTMESALGDGNKQPTDAEAKNMLVARKSIHVAHDLQKGHVISAADLVMKRPGTGISPMQLPQLIGKKINKDLQKNSLLNNTDIE